MRVAITLVSLVALAAPASADTLCEQLLNQAGEGAIPIRFGEGCSRGGVCRNSHGLDETQQLHRGRKYMIAAMLPDGYSQSAVVVKVRVLRAPPGPASQEPPVTGQNNRTVELKRDAIPFACGPDKKRIAYPPARLGNDEEGVEVGYGGYDSYHRSGASSPEERRILDGFHVRYGDRCISTNEWKLRPYFLFEDPDNTPGFLARLFHSNPNSGRAYASPYMIETAHFRVRLTSYSKDMTQRACVSFPLTASDDKIQVDIVDLAWARDAEGRRQPSSSATFEVVK